MPINNNSRKKQHEYYKYIDRPITFALCSNNEFHWNMFKIGVKEGRLISYEGNQAHTFRAADISEFNGEHGYLMDELAYWNAEELRVGGIPLPNGVEQKYKGSLVNSYLLNSTLCYIELNKKNGKESFLATKNPMILSSISNSLAESEKRKKIESFQNQFSMSHEELRCNNFEVVKIVNDVRGLKLSKYKVNGNREGTVIMPYYSLENYLKGLFRIFESKQVCITYLHDGIKQSVVTSLHPELIAKWLRTTNITDVQRVQKSWRNSFDFGEIILPDLYCSKRFVTIKVLDISFIEIL